MLNSSAAARRAIPSLDRLLRLEAVTALIARHGRPLVTEAARAELAQLRAALARNRSACTFDEARFVRACAARLERETAPSLRPVFNLTGTVLHTNLGRALLPQEAAQAVARALTRPVNLEYDLEGAGRGERDRHVERWLTRLTGAEAALVVNNNAAAVYLALNTLALRKEVPVSRGELIEIGGSFRIPDIMARAGAKLVEVGTTNRTHLRDYAGAITPRTAALMKVHTSNYAIQGFTAAVPERDLAVLAHRHRLPLIVDLGSGMLADLEQWGLPHEPTPREALAAGADLVTFSGDKLMGGPQAGLIVGRAALVERLRTNPMKRALRVDKMTLAALEAVLKLYADPARLAERLPTLRLLARPLAEIEAQARRVLPALQAALRDRAQVAIVPVRSQIGSGSLPVDLLASCGIAVSVPGKRRRAAAAAIAAAFRALPTPVIGRVADGAFIMDLRCLEEEGEFLSQLDQLKLENPRPPRTQRG
ncbi:MAG TPA: L-seryl-tRNA(Sec) selenium transferase [Burkholderiales bacterium]|nr:L-seryl-tRNA(Sec) selenium transferase [Burkholderiales bacterium]